MGLASSAAPTTSTAHAAAAPASETARPRARLLQRSCACGGEAGLSGKCEECNNATLRPQRAAGAPTSGGIAPPVVHDALASSSQFLSSGTRRTMETRLGHDFGQVRIHTGPLAEASTRAVHANAFTVGDHVVFGANKYRPGTADGDSLIAHELTHVKQQAGAPLVAPLRIGPANDVYERAANATASSFHAGTAPTARVQRQVIQRQDADTPTPAPAPEPPQPAAEQQADDSPGFLWGMLKKVLPATVVNVVQGIRSKGVIGYFRDRLSGLFGRIFNRLGQGGGFIAGLVQSFTQLAGTMRAIMAALAHNDCKPLFDAISQLGDTLQEMAGAAWDKIKEFFAPIGEFFSDIWKKFGAPVVDFLSEVAGEVWTEIKQFASQLWDSVKFAGALLGQAWSWLKGELGIADTDDGEEGLFGWVKRKLGEAWDAIKAKLDPVIGPVKAFAGKIAAIIPLDTILNLRERVHEWLHHAGEMVRSLAKPQGVTADQASLRDKILPAVKASIVALGGKIADAGGWVAAQIGGLVQNVTDVMGMLRANSIIGVFAGAIDWVETKIQALNEWVQGGVKSLFALAGQGVARLSTFVEPVLGVLEKLVSVIGNVVKMLPDLVLGPVWRAIPECIRNPIKDFIIQHILSAIPIISTFVKLPEIWGKIKQLVLDFLATVFVKGDLAGAAMMVIRFVLEAAGVKVDLFFSVIGKAIDEIDEILMHPLSFLKNIFGAIKKGFDQFLDKIGTHLLQGLLSWLLGPLEDLGIKAPREFTLSAVLDLVLQILGITGAKLRKKLEAAVGPTAMTVLTNAWNWVSTLVTKGPAALWEQIKGQLTGLWDSVIGGIGKWITTDLIKIGIKKLATLSNPVGAIIELIQTVYTTFEFIVTKMNRILALVDSVLDSIGNIIKGNIGAAANMVEDALEKAVAGVISFLADWLGISNPGEKIKEIVETIQETVDKALDWLVSQAITIARSIASGLGFGEKPDERTPAQKEQDLDAGMAEAKALADQPEADATEVRKKLPQIQKKYRLKQLDLQWETSDEYEIIGENSPGKKQKVELAPGDLDTVITYGPTNSQRGGSSMIAHPLTPNHPTGSTPSASPGVWEHIRPDVHTRDGVGLYIRGHLLNMKLGGPGTEENLTPISYSANSNHLNSVEKLLKTWINSPKRDRMVHYEVRVDKPSGKTPPAGLKKEETVLAAGLSWEWRELVATGPDPQHPTFKDKPGGQSDKGYVDNDWPHI